MIQLARLGAGSIVIYLYQEGIPLTWTPNFEACRKFTFQFYKTYLIVRRQFQLSMYAGKTIHKAQGSTVKGAVMHFGDKKMTMYTMLALVE